MAPLGVEINIGDLVARRELRPLKRLLVHIVPSDIHGRCFGGQYDCGEQTAQRPDSKDVCLPITCVSARSRFHGLSPFVDTVCNVTVVRLTFTG
jgi:hypothetical protein